MSSRTAAPSSDPALALADRARVTSLASSAGRSPAPAPCGGVPPDSGGLLALDRGVGLAPAYKHRADAVTSPLGRLGGHVEPVDAHLRAGDRHSPEVLGQQAADGVDVVVVEGDVETVGELVDVQSRAHPQGSVGELLDE